MDVRDLIKPAIGLIIFIIIVWVCKFLCWRCCRSRKNRETSQRTPQEQMYDYSLVEEGRYSPTYTPELDVQEMAVGEAIGKTKMFLIGNENKVTEMKIITGPNEQSLCGKSAIKPAVRNLLDKRKLTYNEVDKGGSFLIYND